MLQSEPLKTGFLVTEVDGSPEDLPVKLRFPNGSVTRTLSNELSVDFVGGSLPTTFVKLSQSPAQTMTGLADGYLKLTSGVIGTGTVDLSTLVPYTGATGDVDLGVNGLTLTDITIGANTLTTLEFSNLDGQDQAVKTTSSPTFAGLTVPTVTGGTATTSDLTLKTTSGVGDAGADMHFLVGDNGAKEALTILNSGFVGIGTTAPIAKLTVETDGDAIVQVSGYGAESGNVGVFRVYSPRGTQASPTANASGDVIGRINFAGYDTALSVGASIAAIAAADWGTAADATDDPTDIVFYTVPDGGSTLTERVRILSTGAVGVGIAAATSRLHVSHVLTGTTPTIATDIVISNVSTNAVITGTRITSTITGTTGGTATGLELSTSRSTATGAAVSIGINNAVSTGARAGGATPLAHYGEKIVVTGSAATSSDATSQSYYGLYAEANSVTAVGETATVYGVRGKATGLSGMTTYGGYFEALGGTTNYGLLSAETIVSVATSVTAASYANLELRSLRTAIVSTDLIGGIDFRSNDTTLTIPGIVVSSIQAVASATHTATELMTDIVFKTTTGTTFAEIMRLTATGLKITGSLQVDSVVNDTGLASGVYTPTRSAEANLDANVTMTEAQYLRVGNTVTVSGRFTADPTLTATTTSFEITLPVASNIGAVEDAAGVAFCGAIVSQGAEVYGSVANNTAVIIWKAGDITSQSWSYTFSYQVI